MLNILFLSPEKTQTETETVSVCIFFSRFEGMRRDKNQILNVPSPFTHCPKLNMIEEKIEPVTM